ncbi:MAG TPA: hypothetical protein VD999_02620 [Vitreimonas sp.]|nr:hypothetical protein [Vitreimonas sp.]
MPSTPSSSTPTSSMGSSFNKTPSRFAALKKYWKIFAGVTVLVLVLLGAGAGFYLTQNDTNIVNQAAGAKCDGWATSGSEHCNTALGKTFRCNNGSWQETGTCGSPPAPPPPPPADNGGGGGGCGNPNDCDGVATGQSRCNTDSKTMWRCDRSNCNGWWTNTGVACGGTVPPATGGTTTPPATGGGGGAVGSACNPASGTPNSVDIGGACCRGGVLECKTGNCSGNADGQWGVCAASCTYQCAGDLGPGAVCNNAGGCLCSANNTRGSIANGATCGGGGGGTTPPSTGTGGTTTPSGRIGILAGRQCLETPGCECLDGPDKGKVIGYGTSCKAATSTAPATIKEINSGETCNNAGGCKCIGGLDAGKIMSNGGVCRSSATGGVDPNARSLIPEGATCTNPNGCICSSGPNTGKVATNGQTCAQAVNVVCPGGATKLNDTTCECTQTGKNGGTAGVKHTFSISSTLPKECNNVELNPTGTAPNGLPYCTKQTISISGLNAPANGELCVHQSSGATTAQCKTGYVNNAGSCVATSQDPQGSCGNYDTSASACNARSGCIFEDNSCKEIKACTRDSGTSDGGPNKERCTVGTGSSKSIEFQCKEGWVMTNGECNTPIGSDPNGNCGNFDSGATACNAYPGCAWTSGGCKKGNVCEGATFSDNKANSWECYHSQTGALTRACANGSNYQNGECVRVVSGGTNTTGNNVNCSATTGRGGNCLCSTSNQCASGRCDLTGDGAGYCASSAGGTPTYGGSVGETCEYACYACDGSLGGACNTGKFTGSGFVNGPLPNSANMKSQLPSGCGVIQCDCRGTFNGSGSYTRTDGGGFNSTVYSCTTRDNPNDYVCKDVNGDGRKECALGKPGEGTMTIYQCAANCSTQPPVIQPPAPNIPPVTVTQESPPPSLPPGYFCNSECGNDAQCATADSRLKCIDTGATGKRCRLPENPTSGSCQAPVGPQCLSIQMTNVTNPSAPATQDPAMGNAIRITCGEVAAITQSGKYQARIVEPDGVLVNLQMTGRVSNNYTITKTGLHAAQCRICTTQDDTSCHSYENPFGTGVTP